MRIRGIEICNVKGIDDYIKLFIDSLNFVDEYEECLPLRGVNYSYARVKTSDIISLLKSSMFSDTTWELLQVSDGHIIHLTFKTRINIQIKQNDHWVDKIETAILLITFPTIKYCAYFRFIIIKDQDKKQPLYSIRTKRIDKKH